MILGIGTDIVDIERISKLNLERFSKRILTTSELELLSKLSPYQQIERLAGRFVAKEAISKALGTGIGERCGFLDIEVLKNKSGAPVANLSKKVLEMLPGDIRLHISISHSKLYAIATAILEA